MKKRIGIVGEGSTDYLVLKCMIDQITGEENDYLRIQPEQNMLGEYGYGWKGVWNSCRNSENHRLRVLDGDNENHHCETCGKQHKTRHSLSVENKEQREEGQIGRAHV